MIDGFVKSLKNSFSVIPAKAGIESLKRLFTILSSLFFDQTGRFSGRRQH